MRRVTKRKALLTTDENIQSTPVKKQGNTRLGTNPPSSAPSSTVSTPMSSSRSSVCRSTLQSPAPSCASLGDRRDGLRERQRVNYLDLSDASDTEQNNQISESDDDGSKKKKLKRKGVRRTPLKTITNVPRSRSKAQEQKLPLEESTLAGEDDDYIKVPSPSAISDIHEELKQRKRSNKTKHKKELDAEEFTESLDGKALQELDQIRQYFASIDKMELECE
eukprot:GILJ01005877.1.p1 GENE.GILJ01005877.1~~GILJ01005877.1.p1  ORF type:complete len:221 (-),score=34.73 GILJ01005877.1:130-792(-)